MVAYLLSYYLFIILSSTYYLCIYHVERVKIILRLDSTWKFQVEIEQIGQVGIEKVDQVGIKMVEVGIDLRREGLPLWQRRNLAIGITVKHVERVFQEHVRGAVEIVGLLNGRAPFASASVDEPVANDLSRRATVLRHIIQVLGIGIRVNPVYCATRSSCSTEGHSWTVDST